MVKKEKQKKLQRRLVCVIYNIYGSLDICTVRRRRRRTYIILLLYALRIRNTSSNHCSYHNTYNTGRKINTRI